MKKKLLLFSLLVFAYTTSCGQIFTDLGEEFAFEVNSIGSDWGNGLSFYDFNDDGWDDLSYGLSGEAPRFFLNEQGVFEEIDLNLESEIEVKSILWVDIDNDGDSDLFLTNYFGGNRLYRNNGDLDFTDITEDSGLFYNTEHETVGASWGDYNNDSFLDVYICNYNWQIENGDIHNFLYSNNGDGTFTDVTDTAGVGNGLQQSFQGVWIDLDRDGWLDLSVINDREIYLNSFYHNNGDGTFTDIAEELNIDVNIEAMSNSWGDYNNDGLIDLYLSNSEFFGGNITFKNTGPYFINYSSVTGTAVNDDCWSANWMDVNNDMLQDLHVSVGFYYPESISPNYFFLNEGNDEFSLSQEDFPDNDGVQYATAIGDYNNDGAVDMACSNNYETNSNFWVNNNNSGNNFLKVSLEGVNVNRDGIGSYIELWTDGIHQTRFTYCGEDYISQDSQREIFGLAQNGSVDSLIVSWQNGWVDRFYDLEANQTIHIQEGSSFTPTISSPNLDLCFGQYTYLYVDSEYNNIEWSSGSNESFIEVSTSGEYVVTATNTYGFTASDTVYVQVNPLPLIEAQITPNICYGEETASINLVNNSGSGYTINVWNGTTLGQSISGLSSGEYYFNYVDSNLCNVIDTVIIEDPEIITLNSSIIAPISCHGICDAEVDLVASGGTGILTINEIPESWCEGLHELEVVDENMCEAIFQIEIEMLEELAAEISIIDITETELGNASIEISGGVYPYDIFWSNGQTGPFADNLDLNSYSVTIIDANGCEILVDFEIALGVDQFATNSIKIIPNPAMSTINISGKTSNYNWYEIHDYLGKKVASDRNVINTIDVSNLPSGHYILSLHNENEILTIPLIKL